MLFKMSKLIFSVAIKPDFDAVIATEKSFYERDVLGKIIKIRLGK